MLTYFKKVSLLIILFIFLVIPAVSDASTASHSFGSYYCVRHGDNKNCDEQFYYLPGVGYTNITVAYTLEGHRHGNSWINTNVCLDNICQWISCHEAQHCGMEYGDYHPYNLLPMSPRSPISVDYPGGSDTMGAVLHYYATVDDAEVRITGNVVMTFPDTPNAMGNIIINTVDQSNNVINAPWSVAGPEPFSGVGEDRGTRIAGEYTINPGDLAGYTKPQSITQTLSDSGTITFNLVYTASSVGNFSLSNSPCTYYTPVNSVVNLNWSPSSGATSYTIFRRMWSNGQWIQQTTLGAGSTSYSDYDSREGDDYYFITASNGSSSLDSNIVSATCTPPITPPICVPNGSCDAEAPACETTTTGFDNCGNSCVKNGGMCICVLDGSCSAAAPACEATTTGVNNCGGTCSKTGGACVGGGSVPSNPTISGPTNGTPNTNYKFDFVSTDSGGKKIQYGIDWDMNGFPDIWLPSALDFVSSGTHQIVFHSWSSEGNKSFQAFAQNEDNAKSGWSSYSVAIGTPPPPPTGSCGSANKTYPEGATSYGADMYCSTGIPSATPTFPSPGSSVNWYCDAGGAHSPVCTATVPIPSHSLVVTKPTGGTVKSMSGTTPDGNIVCGPTSGSCSKNYPKGTTVTLQAFPVSSYFKFSGWRTTPNKSCDSTGVNIKCVIIINEDTTVSYSNSSSFIQRVFNYREF